MKTMRRAFATAIIGVMTAGILGLTAPAASAAPASNSDAGATAVSCNHYAHKFQEYRKIAENSSGLKAKKAQALANKYRDIFLKCIR